jgi:hypothetical protein
VVTVAGKPSSTSITLKDHSNRRINLSGYAAWEIHPAMSLEIFLNIKLGWVWPCHTSQLTQKDHDQGLLIYPKLFRNYFSCKILFRLNRVL